MTALIVTASVLLFLTLLFSLPLTFRAGYREEFTFELRYLFLRFRIVPRPEKKRKEPAEAAPSEEPKEKAPSRIHELLKKEGVSGLIHLLQEMAGIANGAMKRLFAHLTVDEFSLEIRVSGSDAGKTALEYAAACGAVYPAVSILLRAVRYRDYSVRVLPEFQGKGGAEFTVQAHASPFFLCILAGYLAMRLYKSDFRKSMTEDQKNKQKEKMVLPHGRSSD
jgi:hypothetical protein